jgi:DNA polymerase-3 subunit epsilon
MAFQWIGKSEDGLTVTLKRFDETQFRCAPYFNAEWAALNADLIRTGSVLDVETTGLQFEQAKVIEIGIRSFRFNRESGEILEILGAYHSFQDPGEPLAREICELTGLTDGMLKGTSIDWQAVDRKLADSNIVIAHNAAFDRPFVDRDSPTSRQKIWGCSVKQIDWQAKGFTSKKLESLSIYHGFFTDAHRALNDADALLHLLSFPDSSTGKPHLSEMLDAARRPTVQVIASHSPFESKDTLKSRAYRWDPAAKSWWKEVSKESIETEIRWLEESVYCGPFRGKTREILPSDQFKAGSPS